MRIGLFTDVYPPYTSGVATSVEMLKKEFERKGHTVYVVTPNLKGIKTIYDEANKILKVASIPTGIYEDIRLSSFYPAQAVKKIKSWKLDVIHIHTEFGIGNFGKFFGKRFNIPVIYTYHTMYEDHIFYITKGIFDEIGRKTLKHIETAFCKDIAEIIAPSEKVYKLFKEKYNIETNVTLIPNGIEIERFYKEQFSPTVINAYRKDLGIKKDDFIILFVGRVAKEKSIDFVINAMKDITKINDNIKLLIVGDGPEKENLEKLTTRNKLSSKVIFTGMIPWDQVSSYYQLGDVFITASTTENHSMTIIEAMAASVPVICINDESYLSMVIDKETGRIFKNKKELVNIIKEEFNSKKHIEEMKVSARNMAEKYSSKEYASSVLKIYKKAVKNKEDNRLEWISKVANAIKKKRK